MSTFTGTALDIARRLAGEALRAGGGVYWQGATLLGTEDDPRVEYGDTGVDLYSGAAGIGLFLAHAAGHDGTGHLADLARRAIVHASSRTRALVEEGRLGLYDGATGIAVATLAVGRLLADAELVEEASDLALAVARRPSGGGRPESDLISGTAGIVLGLLHVYRHTGHPLLLAAAVTAARRLAAGASAEPWGSSWGPAGKREPGPQDGWRRPRGPAGRSWGVGWAGRGFPEESSRKAGDEIPGAGVRGPNLTGLAHGTAGVALALQEAGTLAQDSRLLRTAVEAMRYERGWYTVAYRNWPDLRRSSPVGERPGDLGPEEKRPAGEHAYPVFWCHGAVGIGLARLRAYRLTGDTAALAEASAAIQATRDLVVRAGTALRHGEPADTSLCHGLAGAAELFLTAAEVLGCEDHLRAAVNVGRLMLGHRDRMGAWPCGVAGVAEVPDLFLGLAGIGLTLLRLQAPGTVMSVSPTGWS